VKFTFCLQVSDIDWPFSDVDNLFGEAGVELINFESDVSVDNDGTDACASMQNSDDSIENDVCADASTEVEDDFVDLVSIITSFFSLSP
jgi:hypothetical protein